MRPLPLFALGAVAFTAPSFSLSDEAEGEGESVAWALRRREASGVAERKVLFTDERTLGLGEIFLRRAIVRVHGLLIRSE